MTRCLLQHSINDFSDCRKRHSIIFYMAEIMDSAFRADGDEIMTTIIFMPWGTCRRNTIFVHKQFVRCHECRFFFVCRDAACRVSQCRYCVFVVCRDAACRVSLYRYCFFVFTETRHAASLQMGHFVSVLPGRRGMPRLYNGGVIYSCSSRIPGNPPCCAPAGWVCRGRRGSAGRSGCSAGSRRFSSSRGTTTR